MTRVRRRRRRCAAWPEPRPRCCWPGPDSGSRWSSARRTAATPRPRTRSCAPASSSSRGGACSTEVVAAGTPPVRQHAVPLPAAAAPPGSRSGRSAGVDALYAPRRTVLDRLLVDAAVEAGAELFASTTVTDLVHDQTAASRACGARRGRACTGRSGRGSPSVPTASAPSWPPAAGADVVRRGEAASAVLYRYLADLPAEGYEWAYGDAAAAGLSSRPTTGRPASSSAPRPAGCGTLRRLGADQAFATLLDRAAPALADRRRRRAARVAPPRLGGAPGVRPPLGRAGLGAGRGRRLLQGPDHHPRHHRRAAGRRAARRRGGRRAGRCGAGGRRTDRATRRPATGSRAG